MNTNNNNSELSQKKELEDQIISKVAEWSEKKGFHKEDKKFEVVQFEPWEWKNLQRRLNHYTPTYIEIQGVDHEFITWGGTDRVLICIEQIL